MTARLVFLYQRRAPERCNCGSPECQRCFPGNHYCECRCEDVCQCDPCDDHETGEAGCSLTCPTRCRCRHGCECAEDDRDRAADDADLANDLARDA